jgi:dihydrolipoamide dehydrogenase
METLHYDSVVVGAGPGGYPCAIRLGQLEQKTLCIERDNWGGVCLNVGCIPSKALITAAKKYQDLKKVATMGIMLNGKATFDMAKTQEWKGGIVKNLTNGVDFLLKSNNVDRLLGNARFVGGKTLEVDKSDGTTVRVECNNLVIAVGSRPIEIPPFPYSEDRILDSTKALDLQEVPKRLAVIGGGYIGLEMGMMLAKLGSEVTVVEMADSVLSLFDPEVVKEITRSMKKLKMKTITGARADGWEEGDDGAILKVSKTDGSKQEIICDKILVTIGRRANSEQLKETGVALNDRGYVITDDQQKTNVDGVYAIGDITGRTMLAHGATYEGELVAEVIAGHDHRKYQARTVPAVVFTDPEIATAGLQEQEAKEQGYEIKVGKMPFKAIGRAMTTGETGGFIKTIIDAADDRVLGVTIVGPNASDLISEAALAVELDAEALDIGLTIHPHPTLGEGIMEAAKHALGEAIHIPNKRK